MNIETKKAYSRYTVCVLFWALIICLGFLLAPAGGSGSGGTGTGSGYSSSGPGRGEGTSGTETGKEGEGNNSQAVVVAPANTAPAAKTAIKKAEGTKVKTIQKQTAQDAPIKIMSKGEANEDAATIYIPGKSTGSGSGSGAATGFFGVKAYGPVIFLLDISGSMAASTSEGMTRLQLVKREVAKTLRNQHAEAKSKKSKDHFRIAPFSNDCRLFPHEKEKGYLFSSFTNVAKATEFVNNLSLEGGTAMKNAWDVIIPITKKEEIHAVYFLSDGEPTDCSPEVLLAYLKHAVPKLRIHTISMGQKSDLLKSIAAQHKGQYREVY